MCVCTRRVRVCIYMCMCVYITLARSGRPSRELILAVIDIYYMWKRSLCSFFVHIINLKIYDKKHVPEALPTNRPAKIKNKITLNN